MRISVVLSNELLNLGNQVLYALEHAMGMALYVIIIEPDFHLVEP